MQIAVVIPAFNEEKSVGHVLRDIPAIEGLRVVVVDNGSTDGTAEVVRRNGATVITEMQKGYGAACLAGIASLKEQPPDVVVFLDADYSDHPQEMQLHIDKINAGYDMVIGSRVLGDAEPGALLPQARWGNLLAVSLIKLFYGFSYTDLGPFRAIRWQTLMDLDMRDEDFGWTVEMQIKAAKQGVRITEVPVSYRKRIGVSKVTGTVKGTMKAGYKILYLIFRSLVE